MPAYICLKVVAIVRAVTSTVCIILARAAEGGSEDASNGAFPKFQRSAAARSNCVAGWSVLYLRSEFLLSGRGGLLLKKGVGE